MCGQLKAPAASQREEDGLFPFSRSPDGPRAGLFLAQGNTNLNPQSSSWEPQKLQSFDSWYCHNALGFDSWYCHNAVGFDSWYCNTAVGFDSWYCHNAVGFDSWYCHNAVGFDVFTSLSIEITTTKNPWWWHVWCGETCWRIVKMWRIHLVHVNLVLQTHSSYDPRYMQYQDVCGDFAHSYRNVNVPLFYVGGHLVCHTVREYRLRLV